MFSSSTSSRRHQSWSRGESGFFDSGDLIEEKGEEGKVAEGKETENPAEEVEPLFSIHWRDIKEERRIVNAVPIPIAGYFLAALLSASGPIGRPVSSLNCR